MENVTKRFGKVVANNAINLELHEGEILSLLGENGSGKTTLMNMLSGIYFPDEGQIYIHGEPVTIASPKDAFEHGIGMIHQHFKLVDLFTATENIILGLEGKLDIAEASKKVKEICDKYGFDIDPNQKIYDMSVSQKQTVEIVKVLYRGADILILDEPTAVLTPQETDKLFAIMRNMKADGKSLIIITHKLHEVLDVSDRVAVLRKGEYVGDVATKDADQQSLTDMMVGHTVSLNISRPEPKDVEKRLVIEGLTAYDELGVKRLDDVSFTINAGEVLGILPENGARIVRLTPQGSAVSVDLAMHLVGRTPLPPYITDYQGDQEMYQTVYSKSERSAAAPTAGLHFTEELLQRIKEKGVGFATVDLEVGLGTFRTVTE